MQHDIDLFPQYFKPISFGSKTFTIQPQARGIQKGDKVTLKEFEYVPSKTKGQPAKKKYSGQEMKREIGFTMPIGDMVILSLLDVADE